MADRAEALLAQVQRVLSFDAGWISLLCPDRDAHIPPARFGYDERVCGYLDSSALLAESNGPAPPITPVDPAP